MLSSWHNSRSKKKPAAYLDSMADDLAVAVLTTRGIAWMAHSKLSNVCRAPATMTSKLLSYSFPHTSHFAIETLLHRDRYDAANNAGFVQLFPTFMRVADPAEACPSSVRAFGILLYCPWRWTLVLSQLQAPICIYEAPQKAWKLVQKRD